MLLRAITIQSGIIKQQQDADTLIVGSGVSTSSGNLTISAGSGSVLIGTGSTLSVTGTGMINLPSQFKVNSSAVSSNVTATNLNTLTGGPASNADALHTHFGSGGGSSGNFSQALVDFGFQTGGEESIATVTVPATWVTSTSTILTIPYAVATADHDPDDYAAEGISAYPTNIIIGTSFDVVCTAPNNTFGKYTINCFGE